MALSQMDIVPIVERVGSIFSLLGCLFIILTFSFCKAFHKPINRLVFYASFGNMLTNVATLIARDFIDRPFSPGCQFQGFLIQMFMPADALWTLAMAINVYLTFYHKFNAENLRRMDRWYLLICYGIPFIPAIIFVFINDPNKGKFYGDAIIWCWVDKRWDAFRIITFYAPVWLIIVTTLFIYIRAGSDIYKQRKQLREFSGSNGTGNGTRVGAEEDGNDKMPPMRSTEVRVTSESGAMDLAPMSPQDEMASSGGSNEGGKGAAGASGGAYSIHIAGGHDRPQTSASAVSSPGPAQSAEQGDAKAAPVVTSSAPHPSAQIQRRQNMEASRAVWGYTKCALLFFTAILITWIPSSANRVYSLATNNQSAIVLEIMSAAVLPLQGFWNACIYCVTSWGAVKQLTSQVLDACVGGSTPKTRSTGATAAVRGGNSSSIHHPWKKFGSESVTELAGSSGSSAVSRERGSWDM